MEINDTQVQGVMDVLMNLSYYDYDRNISECWLVSKYSIGCYVSETKEVIFIIKTDEHFIKLFWAFNQSIVH